MKPLLKCLHLLGVIGFMGAALTMIVLAAAAAGSAAPQATVWRQALVSIAGAVLMPALLLTIISGALAMMLHRPFIDAPWVWAKAACGMFIGGAAMFSWQPAVMQAAALTAPVTASLTVPLAGADAGAAEALAQALRTQAFDAWFCVGLGAVAVVLGVWRPRWGRRAG